MLVSRRAHCLALPSSKVSALVAAPISMGPTQCTQLFEAEDFKHLLHFAAAIKTYISLDSNLHQVHGSSKLRSGTGGESEGKGTWRKQISGHAFTFTWAPSHPLHKRACLPHTHPLLHPPLAHAHDIISSTFVRTVHDNVKTLNNGRR